MPSGAKTYTRAGASVSSQVATWASGSPLGGGEWYVKSINATVTADEAAQGLATLGVLGFENAMSMVGNEGQAVLVETLGVVSFIEAIRAYVNNAYEEQVAIDYLMEASEHPEAIHIIIAESVHVMAERVNAAA